MYKTIVLFGCSLLLQSSTAIFFSCCPTSGPPTILCMPCSSQAAAAPPPPPPLYPTPFRPPAIGPAFQVNPVVGPAAPVASVITVQEQQLPFGIQGGSYGPQLQQQPYAVQAGSYGPQLQQQQQAPYGVQAGSYGPQIQQQQVSSPPYTALVPQQQQSSPVAPPVDYAPASAAPQQPNYSPSPYGPQQQQLIAIGQQPQGHQIMVRPAEKTLNLAGDRLQTVEVGGKDHSSGSFVKTSIQKTGDVSDKDVADALNTIDDIGNETLETHRPADPIPISSLVIINDPQCNNNELRAILLENIDENLNTAKRLIQLATEAQFGGQFDVICSKNDFSYLTNTELYCQTSKGSVSCYAYRQL